MILLDTQVLIWLLFDDQKLGSQARRVIDDAWKAGEAYVSAISFWEMTMLHEKRRLDVLLDVDALRANLLTEGLLEVAVNGAIGIRAVGLPDLPRDPADRIVV
ncbi:MAG: type II toxin-antitoxin system VapC family toxin, partial [Chloroflexi bacterium]|nr:type II toxin-antitoxin system VapC family toxin [Chloroflexota bacterium]